MKSKSFFVIVALASLIFVGCDKQQDADVDITVDQPTSSIDTPNGVLNPSEQKNYLQTVAKEFMGYFNTSDQQYAINILDQLVYKYEDYDWDVFEDLYEDNFDLSRSNLPRYISNLYRAPQANKSLNLQASDFGGIFEANDRSRRWEYVGDRKDGGIELRFVAIDGTACTATVISSGTTTTLTEKSYMYDSKTDTDEQVDINVKVPAKVDFKLSTPKQTLVSAVVDVDIKDNNHYNTTIDAKVANISIKEQEKVSMSSAAYGLSMKYGNTTLLAVTAEAPDYYLPKRGKNESYEDWFESFEDDYETLLKRCGKAIAEFNLLGALQVKMNVTSVANAYNQYMKIDNLYGQEYYEGVEEWFKKYIPIGVYYGSDKLQALLLPEALPYEYYDYYYGRYETEYDLVASIYFPSDKSSYSIEDYFTRSRFNSVIQMAESLVNRYINLLKYNNIEEVDF